MWGRGLEARMKIYFARRTFSDRVLQWWVKLQQGHINRGEDPCRIWIGMKVVLRHHYDSLIETIAYGKKVVADGQNFLRTTK